MRLSTIVGAVFFSVAASSASARMFNEVCDCDPGNDHDAQVRSILKNDLELMTRPSDILQIQRDHPDQGGVHDGQYYFVNWVISGNSWVGVASGYNLMASNPAPGAPGVVYVGGGGSGSSGDPHGGGGGSGGMGADQMHCAITTVVVGMESTHELLCWFS